MPEQVENPQKKSAAMELPFCWLESASFQLFFMKSTPNWDDLSLRAIPT